MYGNWTNATVQVRLDKGAIAPTRAHENDAGLDLYVKSNDPQTTTIEAGSSCTFDTGIHLSIPAGYVGMVFPRSVLNVNDAVVCGTGVIDSGYDGGIVVRLYNHGHEKKYVHAGDRIAQLVVLPIALPNLMLPKYEMDGPRGEAGFGSTGR